MIPVLICMLFFGIIHSISASKEGKEAVKNRIGERAYHAFYRAGYNVFSIITLAPAVYFFTFHPGETVWSINPHHELPLHIIQAIGNIGVILSLVQIDLLRFAGIKQLWAYVNNQPLPLPDERLKTGGVFALVRHPLYLFSLMTMWPVSTMTEAYLAFVIGATLYFAIGSYYEEKRLVQAYGQQYQDYRLQVPWLLPLPRFSNKP